MKYCELLAVHQVLWCLCWINLASVATAWVPSTSSKSSPAAKKRTTITTPPSPQNNNKPVTSNKKKPKQQTEMDSAVMVDAFVVQQQNEGLTLPKQVLGLLAAVTVSAGAAWIVNQASIPTIPVSDLDFDLSHGTVQSVQFSGSSLTTVHVVYKDGTAARVTGVALAAPVAQQCQNYDVPSNFVQAVQEKQTFWQAEQGIANDSHDAAFLMNAGLL
jgi:hypothetical protein